MPDFEYEEVFEYEEEYVPFPAPPTPGRRILSPDDLKSELRREQLRVLGNSYWSGGWGNGPAVWNAGHVNHTRVAQFLQDQPQWVLKALIREGYLDRNLELQPHPETGKKYREQKPQGFWHDFFHGKS